MKATMKCLARFGMAVIMIMGMGQSIWAAAPDVTQTTQTVNDNDTAATAPLGRDGYASDAEYVLSDEYNEAIRQEFYRLINEHRTANGLKELEINLELQAYADIRAAEQRKQFGHTRPDKSPAGSGWHDSKNQIGSRYAENVRGVGSLNVDPITAAETIFLSWKNSSGHNKHMLADFAPEITMAFGISPELNGCGEPISGAVFSTGY